MASLPVPGTGEPDINHGPSILGACGTMTAIAVIAVVTRMYVRIFMIRSVSWDDYLIVASVTLSFTGMMVIIPEVAYGGGRHVVYISSPADVVTGLKLNFVTQPIYLFAITFVKLSIGLFLLRFAPSKGFIRFIWGTIIFIVVYTIIGITTLMTQCRPLTVLWDSTVEAVCFSQHNLQLLAYINAALGIVADIIFAVLPIPMLWNIQVNNRVKSALFLIMSLGIFASAASVVKLYYITSYGLTGDFLYDSTNLTIWTCTECNIGILAASIPTFKPLFKALLSGSSYFNTKYGQRSTKGYAQHNASGVHGSRITGGTRTDENGPKGDDYEMFNSKNGVTAVATSTGTVSGRMQDNISEESILPLQGYNGGIMKSTQVKISSASNDEMGRPRSIEDRV